MTNNQIVNLIALVVLSSVVVCCKGRPQDERSTFNRTVIHYMVADNNLYENSQQDINEMESAWNNDYDGNMVVFLYPLAKGYPTGNNKYNPNPRLLLIRSDNNKTQVNSRILREYNRAELDPCDPATMRSVINDAMALAPATSYALSFWSHGSGWIPKGVGQPLRSVGVPLADESSQTLLNSLAGSKIDPYRWDPALDATNGATGYTIGVSNSYRSELEINALATALSPLKFDFILFDACHMACVEVAYQLRGITKYVIASVAETWATGFPYETVTAPMMASTADVSGIARGFYDYYNAKDGIDRSATVSVVNTEALPELAQSIADLCHAGVSVTPSAQQQFGRAELRFQNTFYDLGDFVRTTWQGRDLSAFENALAKTITYKAATPWLFHGTNSYGIEVKTHSGLSCFIPRSTTPLSLEAYRKSFDWSTASGMNNLIP